VNGIAFGIIVVGFVVIAVVAVRRTQKGAFVARLPVEDGEQVLFEEERLKVWERFRKMAVRGGGTTTLRVRSRLTDRRIILATGGPEGKHRFTVLAILDYSTPSPPVPETGYEAYKRKFGLANGYPTYGFSAGDISLLEGGDGFRVIVPFPEAGDRWGELPEIKVFTAQAPRYLDAVGAVRGLGAATR
jgi:hypothetical protein